MRVWIIWASGENVFANIQFMCGISEQLAVELQTEIVASCKEDVTDFGNASFIIFPQLRHVGQGKRALQYSLKLNRRFGSSCCCLLWAGLTIPLVEDNHHFSFSGCVDVQRHGSLGIFSLFCRFPGLKSFMGLGVLTCSSMAFSFGADATSSVCFFVTPFSS